MLKLTENQKRAMAAIRCADYGFQCGGTHGGRIWGDMAVDAIVEHMGVSRKSACGYMGSLARKGVCKEAIGFGFTSDEYFNMATDFAKEYGFTWDKDMDWSKVNMEEYYAQEV